MAVLKLKELSKKAEQLTGGHRMCAGCGAPIVVRQVLMAIDEPVIIANATGCLEVATTIYPYSAWKLPWIHSAFENAAATISGVEAMYQSLKRQGKLPVDQKIKFIAFGGDNAPVTDLQSAPRPPYAPLRSGSRAARSGGRRPSRLPLV